jgi:hypothetical protein
MNSKAADKMSATRTQDACAPAYGAIFIAGSLQPL